MTAKQKHTVLSLLCVMLLLTVGGCGYSRGSLLPSHLKTVYVDNFKNMINVGREVTEASRYTLYRPGLENDITDAVVDRFVFDGNLRIASREEADMVLSGKLIDYRQEPLRYDKNDNVEEYRIKITVDLELENTVDKEIMWKEAGFIGEATYKKIGRLATSEDTARQEAIEDLARRIVERTVECW